MVQKVCPGAQESAFSAASPVVLIIWEVGPYSSEQCELGGKPRNEANQLLSVGRQGMICALSL